MLCVLLLCLRWTYVCLVVVSKMNVCVCVYVYRYDGRCVPIHACCVYMYDTMLVAVPNMDVCVSMCIPYDERLVPSNACCVCIGMMKCVTWT